MESFKNIGIKAKLIIIFIIFKLIPLFILAYVAIYGIDELHSFIEKSNNESLDKSIQTVEQTATLAIEDSIEALDKKSQMALEIKTSDIANNVAKFLYERDSDLLYLASQNQISKDFFISFYNAKTKDVIIPEEFTYDEQNSKWITVGESLNNTSDLKAIIKENEKYFNHHKPKVFKTQKLKLYKEITYLDLRGREQIKVSSINEELKNISFRENTYIKAEDYFKEIKDLKEGEIYVSNVIGEYIGTKVIGSFTKQKVKEANIEFKPENHAYAGSENPKGKRFEGIIRFITPKYEDGIKVGYITLALDHRHIMEFTDYVVPTKENLQNYSDASSGNYAFMWDSKGRNISHPRDYFIVGYDASTGKRVKPWLSDGLAKKIDRSGIYWEEYLMNYPKFEEQSLNKKPNLDQLKNEAKVALDCRYLNFAPQCSDWMNISADGGYGSFVIYWSNVWKLTTVAAIPYYSGQYGESKRGFGFVTLGANLNEFHEATNKTKDRIELILMSLERDMEEKFDETNNEIAKQVKGLIRDLSASTMVMTVIVIMIAVFLSNYLTSSIAVLIEGTKRFRNKEFDHRIKVKSKDEIGVLGAAFNNMAKEIEDNINNLDYEVEQKTKELKDKNIVLEEAKKIANLGEWELDLDSFESRWSDNVFIMFGLDKDQVIVNKELLSSLMYDEDWEEFQQTVRACIKNKSDFSYTYRIKRADDNKTQWFDCRGKFIIEKNTLLGTIQNITRRKIKEKQIKNYVELIDKNIITSSTDLDGVITQVSEAFCKISGYSKSELLGNTHSMIKHPDIKSIHYKKMWDVISNGEIWQGEIKNQNKDNTSYWVKATISPIFDEEGNKTGYTAIRQDITDKKIIEEISIRDGLTSIFNRRHFNEIFPDFINSAKRNKEYICFMILDIDYFKQYNDTYGHQLGDSTLISVANALQDSLLRADDYCFRLGGEEFGVLYKSNSSDKAYEFANKIRENISALKIEHKKSEVSQYISASIGLVYKNAQDISSDDEVYSLADELLYKAKENGRNKVVSNF